MAKVDAEATLDGVYVVRTSVTKQVMDADQAVRSYKQLANVERAFRCLKSVDLMVRPIRHRLEDRVRAHIFLCALAYYVQWHMIEAWRPLLFADEDLERSRISRDPVAKARPSSQVNRKKSTHHTPDGWPVHSLHSLMTTMGTRCINTCRVSSGTSFASFEQVTEPTPLQEEVYRLLGVKP